MGGLDGILGQVAGNMDINGLAAKIGLSPAQVESALGSLVKVQPQPGDTASAAAADSGLSIDKIGALLNGIGGEGVLAQITAMVQGQGGLSGLTGFLDKDGDGSVVDDLTNLASGFFGKK